jgi:type IV pilus assembly protein PilN
MIRINLLPREEKARRKPATLTFNAGELVWPAAILGVAIAVVAVTALQQNMRASTLKKSIAQVEVQSRELAPQIERVDQLVRERAELDLRLGIIARLEKGRTQSVRLMDELARCVPDHLWLSTVMQEASGSLNVEGVTFSNLVVSDFMSRLERSKLFNDVELGVAERGLMDGKQVVRFTVTCSVNPEPDAN